MARSSEPLEQQTSGGIAGGGGPPEVLLSLERGMRVLAYLNHVGCSTTGELARALQLKRSTAHRILGVLAELGYAKLDEASRLYTLTARVLDLSAGFRDDAWIGCSVEPRMRRWTREHRWPLVLSTAGRDTLTVRISTEDDSPVALDRFVPGQLVPLHDSPAGALFHAYVHADADRLRVQGYAWDATDGYWCARASVPLLADTCFLGVLTLRCFPEAIERDVDRELWAERLKSLAAEIVSECGALISASVVTRVPRWAERNPGRTPLSFARDSAVARKREGSRRAPASGLSL